MFVDLSLIMVLVWQYTPHAESAHRAVVCDAARSIPPRAMYGKLSQDDRLCRRHLSISDGNTYDAGMSSKGPGSQVCQLTGDDNGGGPRPITLQPPTTPGLIT